MAKLINIGFGNVVNSRKIVAVVSPDAAPVKRMIQSIKGTRSLIDATQGRKTKAVIVTSDDYLVLSALQPETIARRFAEANNYEEKTDSGNKTVCFLNSNGTFKTKDNPLVYKYS